MKFDPVKDDVEEFMTTIKNLTSTLAFNEEAQVMAIKSNMPRDIYGLCMQYDKLHELKKFLIELFENPRMKSAVPSITAEADTSAFSNLQSPHIRDIYLNLTQNKVPLGKGAAKRLEQNARNYLILDGLLSKIIELEDGRLDTVLCIPTSKVHILLDTYHSSLIGGHFGITKCYQTISQRFYCPNLAENLRAYIGKPCCKYDTYGPSQY